MAVRKWRLETAPHSLLRTHLNNKMSRLRLIARLDVKAPFLIKGVRLEGLRKLGNPHDFALRYYAAGADEILYIDSVASLYERNTILDLVERTAEDVFIPITVGGGIRTLDDARAMLRAGADKLAVNTAAIRRPELIRNIAQCFGSQCMVLGIEAKTIGNGRWECYVENGREKTGIDVVEWAQRGQALGAGEILLTSVDQEGTRNGFDVALVRTISNAVTIPVIASGGMGTPEHLLQVVENGKADAVAMAHVLHYEQLSLPNIRAMARAKGHTLRAA
jgi:cyclase